MDAKLLDQLLASDYLPSLPIVATQVLALSNDSVSSLEDYADLIQRDVALAAQIIKMANSGYYGNRFSVSNIHEAVKLIGLSAVVPLVVVFSMRGLLYTTKSPIDLTLYWKRTVLSSCLCSFLSRYAEGVSCEEAMLAGLLQDIGILAACAVFPDKYCEIKKHFWLDHDKVIAEEKAIFGIDHSSIGAYLLGKWRIPVSISNAVLSSHQVPDTGCRDLEWCVSGSNILTSNVISGIENQNLWEEISITLGCPWLDLASGGVEGAVIAVLNLVSETENLFDITILPEDIESMLKYVSKEYR